VCCAWVDVVSLSVCVCVCLCVSKCERASFDIEDLFASDVVCNLVDEPREQCREGFETRVGQFCFGFIYSA